MSGFGGQMTVYRQISIDRFDKKNLKSTVFLLSHCHRDHMIGLDQLSFLRCLESRNGVFLYCSKVTKLLLLSEDVFKPLGPYIQVLEVGVSTTVTVPDPESDEFKSVAVTALPAGHCPGSVMFLIEGKEGRALYTGDFRWERNYATTFPALCENGHVKEIDSMYVDTTFCVPEAFHIPSRDDCLAATASLVVAWLRRSSRHFVHVSSRTKYGHEPLLSHLAREAKTKVHTSKAKVNIYEQIRELYDVFTDDPTARIHACQWQENRSGGSQLPCGYIPPGERSADSSKDPEVLVVRPSTMWFTTEPSRLQELVVSPASGRGLHRVCYSFHSSYSEIRDLVSLLRPRRVFPNVLPASDSDWGQVTERLQKFLQYQHIHHMAPAGDSDTARPLGLLKRKRTESIHNLTDSEGLVFDSPERPKQARQDSGKVEEVHQSSQKSGASSIISSAKSDAQSSYKGSDLEEDLFAESGEEDTTPGTAQEESAGGRRIREPRDSQSLRSYVSGDEELPEDDQVSSPQFRHFTSCDDLPGDQPELCLDYDRLGKSTLADDADAVCHKAINRDIESCSVQLQNTTGEQSFLMETEKCGGKISSEDLSKKYCDKSSEKQMYPADHRSPDHADKQEERGESASRNPTTDCSLQRTISPCEKIKEPGSPSTEKNSSETDNGNVSNESKNKLKTDSFINEVDFDMNGEGRKKTDVNENSTDLNDGSLNMRQTELDTAFSDRSKDKIEDVKHCSEPGDSNDSNPKSLLVETNKAVIDGSSWDEPRPCSSEDDKKKRPCSAEGDLKIQSSSADEVQPYEAKDGETTQASSEDDGKKTQQDGASKDKETHNDSSTDRRQETNIIISDSDSDGDCKITKLFMRKRPVNPWQKFYNTSPPLRPPPHCPGHTKHVSMQWTSGQRTVCVDTGTIHRCSVDRSPGPNREQRSLAMRGEMNERKCEQTDNLPGQKRRENSIDLTLNENDTADSVKLRETDISTELTENDASVKQKSLADDRQHELADMPGRKTGTEDSNFAAEDADVEDNNELEDPNTKNIMFLPTSAHSSRISPRKVPQGSLDVIVIDDSENCVTDPSHGTSATLLEKKRKGDRSGLHNTNTVICPVHRYTCSTNQKVIDSVHRQSQFHSCSPLKCAVSEANTSIPLAGGSPAKRSRSGSVRCLDPAHSPVKETISGQPSSPKKENFKKEGENSKCSVKKIKSVSASASNSKLNSDTEKSSCDERDDCGEKQIEQADQTGSQQDKESGDNKTEEDKVVDEDSDITLPPDSPGSTVPPDSPVAVHSSSSDSDVDCKITQSFIRSPQGRGERTAIYNGAHQVHCPMAASCLQQTVAPCPQAGQQHGTAASHSHISQLAAGQCQLHHSHVLHSQEGSRPQKGGAGVNMSSASALTQIKESGQSSVIDLTEDDQ